VGGPRAPLALAGLLERVSASARERARAAAHALDGPAGELGSSVRGRAGRASLTVMERTLEALGPGARGAGARERLQMVLCAKMLTRPV